MKSQVFLVKSLFVSPYLININHKSYLYSMIVNGLDMIIIQFSIIFFFIFISDVFDVLAKIKIKKILFMLSSLA